MGTEPFQGDSSVSEERWPTEIRLSADRRVLKLAFDDGGHFDLPAEYLRV